MSITYGVKLSQSALGEGKSNMLFVDNAYATTGIGIAKFISVNANGTSDAYVGQTLPTWQLADASDKKPAQGLVYVTSARKKGISIIEQLEVKDDNFYPYGLRESQGLIPLHEAEIVVKDTSRDYFFNTTQKALTGTVSVAGGALSTVAGVGTKFTTELRVGDYILVGGIEKQVSAIATDVSLTVSVAFTGAVASATGYISTDLFKPVYLAEDGGFTKLVPVTAGTLKQIIGFVINGNNIKVELENLQGTIL